MFWPQQSVLHNAVRYQETGDKWVVISGLVVKATVFCIAGDNLGSHNI